MYEQFTDRARTAMQLANQEAQRFNHEFIDSGHILLGLIKEGSGNARTILDEAGVTLRMIRLEIEKIHPEGAAMVTMGKLSQMQDASDALASAITEAKALDHNYVGTEHLLLGLLNNNIEKSVAITVLCNLGVSLSDLRRRVMELLGVVDKSTVAKWEHAVTGNPLTLDAIIKDVKQLHGKPGCFKFSDFIALGSYSVRKSAILWAQCEAFRSGNRALTVAIAHPNEVYFVKLANQEADSALEQLREAGIA